MKSSWMGIGFSHHSVPSLSKTATRSSGGTNPESLRRDPPDEVQDGLLAGPLTPARQRIAGRSRLGGSDVMGACLSRPHLDDHAARLALPAAVRITRQG